VSSTVSLFLQSIRQIGRQVYNTTIAEDSRHHGFKQNDSRFKILKLETKKRVTHCIVSYSYAEYRLWNGIWSFTLQYSVQPVYRTFHRDWVVFVSVWSWGLCLYRLHCLGSLHDVGGSNQQQSASVTYRGTGSINISKNVRGYCQLVDDYETCIFYFISSAIAQNWRRCSFLVIQARCGGRFAKCNFSSTATQ